MAHLVGTLRPCPVSNAAAVWNRGFTAPNTGFHGRENEVETHLPLSPCNISPQSLVRVPPAMVKSSQCPGQLKSRLRSSGSLMFYYCFCRSLMGNTLVWTSSIMFTQSYATRLFGRAVLCIFIISIYLCVRWRMSTRVQASAQAHTYMRVYPFSLLLISSWCGFGWKRLACLWTKYF